MKIIKIELPAVITASNRKKLVDGVAAALRKNPRKIILDARKVSTASLSTQRFFIAVSKIVEDFSGVAVTSASSTLYDMLILTGLQKFMRISRVRKATPKPRRPRAK